jgi:hypothetical protein
MFDSVDGGHGDSSGRTGFQRDYAKVYEREVSSERVSWEFGSAGAAHFAVTKARLIEKCVSAWMLSETWAPAGPGAKP